MNTEYGENDPGKGPFGDGLETNSPRMGRLAETFAGTFPETFLGTFNGENVV